MKKVYGACDDLMVGYLKGVLEGYGIPCVIRNELLRGGAGELPPTECWPELWVTEDADYQRALALVEGTLAPQHGAMEWRCPRCGETLEGQFTECWNCGALRPELS